MLIIPYPCVKLKAPSSVRWIARLSAIEYNAICCRVAEMLSTWYTMEAGYIPVGTGNGGAPPSSSNVVAPPVNVIRAPGLKRGKMEEAISDRVSFSFVHVNKMIIFYI